jgi:transcriptional regulator with XRE-family HTH domain
LGQKLGLTATGYGHYERGRQAFSIEQLFVIARVLDRPVEWFLGLNSELSDDELLALGLYRRAVRNGVGEAALRVLGAVAGEEE